MLYDLTPKCEARDSQLSPSFSVLSPMLVPGFCGVAPELLRNERIASAIDGPGFGGAVPVSWINPEAFPDPVPGLAEVE